MGSKFRHLRVAERTYGRTGLRERVSPTCKVRSATGRAGQQPHRLRAAHEDRFDALCATKRQSVLRYVKRLTGNSHSAEDIVQVVLIRAWRSLHTLADDRAVTGWLSTIARREVARAHSGKRLDTEDLDGLSATDQLLASRGAEMPPDDLRFLLESMSSVDRTVLLQTVYGYSADEIAAVERCPAGRVRTRLFRARGRLRSLLMD